MTCKKVAKKAKNCKVKIYQEFCPLTCEKCPQNDTSSPSASPTSSPSASPTSSPSVSPTSSPSLSPTSNPSSSPTSSPSVNPTSSPSASPTSSPSASPTISPSASPTTKLCTLSGTVQFQPTATSGYHSDRLRVTKEGKKSICNKDKSSTTWGCTHDKGTATFYKEDGYDTIHDSEMATIENAAGGDFRFTLQHHFSKLEVYYPEDEKNSGVLNIAVNDDEIGTARHSSPNEVSTHLNVQTPTSGEIVEHRINGAYIGIVFVDVSCDEECSCTMTETMPTCAVSADLSFPPFEDVNMEDGGYHEDIISVTKQGEKSMCSSVNSLTDWCTHDGSAMIYSPSREYYDLYESINSMVSIVIPEAASGNFLFEVVHRSSDWDTYYEDDHKIAGMLNLWVNGVVDPDGPYLHGVDENTHNSNGEVNPNYQKNLNLSVDCDQDCNCTVKEIPYQCTVTASVLFPAYAGEGYHNDFVSIHKIGSQQLCNSDYPEAPWGCTHDRGDAAFGNLNGEIWSTNETAIISDASNGQFRIKLEHWHDDNEILHSGDQDYVGVMHLSVNDEQPRQFSHPLNGDIDTHNLDGSENLDYKGITYVDVNCDTNCHCDIKEHVPTCVLTAKLKIPQFLEKELGYHEDIATVSKTGETDVCGYYDPLSSWGCLSDGSAYLSDFTDDNFDGDDFQTIFIPDASNGEFYFNVQHVFSKDETYYETDHAYPGTLTFTGLVNDEVEFRHPRNIGTETHNADGTINPDYKDSLVVRVKCNDCECEAEKIKNR